MNLSEHRRTMVRVGIYLLALILVLLLFLQRSALIPPYVLQVTQMRETSQMGCIVAGEEEKLVVVEVRLVAPVEIQGRLRPGLFALLDAEGHEHQPDSLSPLFSHALPLGQDEGVEGTLVFRMPREVMGKSLCFHPEVEEDASDRKSENIGPKGGP